MDRIEFISKNDGMIRQFGMRVEEAGDGYAKVSVVVEDAFLNQHGVAHGALVFALADVAFAIAVNSLTDAMGVQWSLNILRAARAGETLTAECSTVHRGSRLFVVHYTVTSNSGKLVAQGQATALPVENTAIKTGGDAPAG
ncbi:MAG: PaaI family thioesterase [Actinobacteria bacterium]|nr:PaaI family thioesterase [Actinomycetota bacterium]